MIPGAPNSSPDAARLLAVLADALEVLLRTNELHGNIQRALAMVGEHANADRSYFFTGVGPQGDLSRISQKIEWVRPGVIPQIDNLDYQNYPLAEKIPRWFDELSRGRPLFGHTADFHPDERPLLEEQQIRSIVMVPIMQNHAARGFIGFDACTRDREWTATDIAVLRALAAGIGGALERHTVETSLSDYASDLLRSRRVALSLMEDAQIAQKRADAANQEKSRFLAVMSHEMRTPLNGILGFAELIASEATGPIREHAGTIQASGHLLLSLISDLLDFSKIEAGRLELAPTDGRLRDHVERVLAIFTPACRNRGIQLRLEFDPTLPTFARTDFLRYEQVLLNLVGNAVKFTTTGGITVRLRPARPDASPDIILTEIEDTGIGIAPEAFNRIFEPFSQAHSRVHQEFGGTGLGLAICKRLVNLLGGDLSVESEPGRGSTFRFTLPLGRATSPAPALSPAPADATPTPPPDARSLRVLIVDDVATNRELAATLLRRMGAEVWLAPDGPTALRLTRETTPHLVLMDVLMPEMDGTEAARAIRAEHPDIPRIAALSADATAENEERCRLAGMEFFLTKPINRRALEHVVRTVLEPRPPA